MNDFFTFTKGERVAVIVLAAVIFIIIAANFFISNQPSNVNENLHDLDSIWALHEKAKDESLKSKEVLSHQVETYQSHKNNNKQYVVDASQQVSKSESKSAFKIQSSKAKVQSSTVNINSADTTELKSLPGIGSFFAKNIVEYREKLGGFIEINQLLEVYAFDSARLETIAPYINVDSVSLRRINVNTDDFKTILRHPYIEYEDVKKIVNYRENKGFIKNWNEYLEVVGKDDVDERLRWYLEF